MNSDRSNLEQFLKLKEMLDKNLITEQEFHRLKDEIVSQQAAINDLPSNSFSTSENSQVNPTLVREGIGWPEVFAVLFSWIGVCAYLFTRQPRKKKINVAITTISLNIVMLLIGALLSQSESDFTQQEDQEIIKEFDNSQASVSEISPVATEEISYEKAKQIVENWLDCKSQLLQTPYDRTCGSDVLTGKAHESTIRRSDGEQSSVDWLESNNSYYIFSNQSVERVKDLDNVNAQEAIADIIVTEQRILYGPNGIDHGSSGYDQRVVRYQFKLADGSWKIADFETVEVLWERQITDTSVATNTQNQRKALNVNVTGFVLDAPPTTRSGTAYYDDKVIAFPYHINSNAKYEYVCPINGGRLISDGYAKPEHIHEQCQVTLDDNGVPTQVELYNDGIALPNGSSYLTKRAIFSNSNNSQINNTLTFSSQCEVLLDAQEAIVREMTDKIISFEEGQSQLLRLKSRIDEVCNDLSQ